MSLRRSTRSTIALITALLLLVCQTAFAAQACAHPIVTAAGAATARACDESADDAQNSHKPSSAVANACQAGTAIGDAAKVEVHGVTDWPAISVSYSNPTGAASTSRMPAPVDAACHSPPLTILHCRLLN